MTLNIQDLRTGFQRPFWVANFSEIFERLSYYAVFAGMALYLNKTLGFPAADASTLTGWFGSAVWFMAIFGGILADRWGFRRALSTAYFILTFAYLLVGALGTPWLDPIRAAIPNGPLTVIILFLPALGVALVKPSVVGTTAQASRDSLRSIAYAIYYTMVNVGSFFGPIIAGWAHQHFPALYIYIIAATSVALMFFVVLAFYRNPQRAGVQEQAPKPTLREFAAVLANWRFMIFVVLFSGFWIVYWQQYDTLTLYLSKYAHVDIPEYVLAVDPLIVITCTVLVNTMTRKLRSFSAVVLGTLITSIGWLALAWQASLWAAALSLFILAVGEIIQSPRYYEYVSRLAPAGQHGTYLGFAFVPIGIGSLVGGRIGGMLFHHFCEVTNQPGLMWVSISAIGVVTTVLLWIYDRVLLPRTA